MEIIETGIKGLVLLKPKVFGDHRGYFFETFEQEKYSKVIGNQVFVQDNESKSSYGVIRGLHFQKPPYAQAKLVRCVVGKVLDVAVDLRQGSATYGKSHAVLLSDENKEQFYVPRGFAHGFAVLSEEAIFAYKVDNIYAPKSEGGISYNDPQLKIDWQIDLVDIKASEKDLQLPNLVDFKTPFI